LFVLLIVVCCLLHGVKYKNTEILA